MKSHHKINKTTNKINKTTNKINKTTNKTNKTTNKTNKRNKTRKHKNISGGKVIGSGGYGCIFRPALKCKNESSLSNKSSKQITKLMTIKHANYEYEEITQFIPFLQKIPNYKNYFIIDDITLCEPTKLTESDLENFKKCKALKKKNITKQNINEHLDELLALNLPDGGIDVGDYVDDNKSIPELNKMLINLLKYGIIPMNLLYIYHCDVKGSNILIGDDNQARLIDWGLSAKTNGSTIPKIFSRKPLQYNIPFSSILFNDTFTQMYKEFKKNDDEKNIKQIKSFVRKYLYAWNDERGEGHLKLINKLIKLSSGKSGITVIIDYLSEIIMKFENNLNYSNNEIDGNLDWIMHYFKNIYLKNIDIWGWIMSYAPILEEYKTEKLKYIFNKYLYNPKKANEVINIHELIEDISILL